MDGNRFQIKLLTKLIAVGVVGCYGAFLLLFLIPFEAVFRMPTSRALTAAASAAMVVIILSVPFLIGRKASRLAESAPLAHSAIAGAAIGVILVSMHPVSVDPAIVSSGGFRHGFFSSIELLYQLAFVAVMSTAALIGGWTVRRRSS